MTSAAYSNERIPGFSLFKKYQQWSLRRTFIRNTHGWQPDRPGQVGTENMRLERFWSCSSLLNFVRKAIDWELGMKKTKTQTTKVRI